MYRVIGSRRTARAGMVLIAASMVLGALGASGFAPFAGGLAIQGWSYTIADSDGDGFNDTYNLDVNVSNSNLLENSTANLTAYLDWGTVHEDTNVTSRLIEAGQSSILSLTLRTKAAPTGGRLYHIIFDLKDEQNLSSGNGEDFKFLFPVGIYGVQLLTDNTDMTMQPTQSAHYQLTVGSMSNNNDTFTLATASSRGWPVSLDNASFSLTAESHANAVLTVQVPLNATPGTRDTTTVTARSERDPMKTASLTFNTTAAPRAVDFTLANEEDWLAGAPGHAVTFHLNLTNQGNYNDTIAIAVGAPLAGWTAVLSENSVTLSPHDWKVVILTVTDPATYSGVLKMVSHVTATSDDGVTSHVVNLTTFVGLPDLVINATDIHVSDTSPVAGEPVNVTVTVHNEGLVRVDLAPVRLEAFGVAREMSLPIPAGGQTDYVFNVNATAGSQTVNATADPSGTIAELNETNNKASIQQTVRAPDLAITPADISFIPSTANSGDVVQVTVVVHNIGTADAQNFNVTLDFGTVEIGRKAVALVAANGGHVTVSFPWTALSGNHTFSVTLDPDHVLNEVTTGNDVATAHIEVNVPPTSALAALNGKPTAGKSVMFDATGSRDIDGSVVSYLFDFGDGTNSSWVSTPKVNHTYKKDGTYVVTVKVKDNKGVVSTSAATQTVKVEKKPTPGFGAALLVLAGAAGYVAARRSRKDLHR